MKNIVILASGSGTNAENIIEYFRASPLARVKAVMSNNPGAGVLRRAHDHGVPSRVFSREDLYRPDGVLAEMEALEADYIVLAGFLWLVPPALIERYRTRMINIHPALLPKYGGKGMYGERVHRAVVEAGERESGITIHHVNEVYDSGDIIARFTVALDPSDTPEEVAAKVHALEYEHFPEVIEREILKLK